MEGRGAGRFPFSSRPALCLPSFHPPFTSSFHLSPKPKNQTKPNTEFGHPSRKSPKKQKTQTLGQHLVGLTLARVEFVFLPIWIYKSPENETSRELKSSPRDFVPEFGLFGLFGFTRGVNKFIVWFGLVFGLGVRWKEEVTGR